MKRRRLNERSIFMLLWRQICLYCSSIEQSVCVQKCHEECGSIYRALQQHRRAANQTEHGRIINKYKITQRYIRLYQKYDDYLRDSPSSVPYQSRLCVCVYLRKLCIVCMGDHCSQGSLLCSITTVILYRNYSFILQHTIKMVQKLCNEKSHIERINRKTEHLKELA